MRFRGFSVFIEPDLAGSYPLWRLFTKRKRYGVAFCQACAWASGLFRHTSNRKFDNHPLSLLLASTLKSTTLENSHVISLWHNELDRRHRAYGLLRAPTGQICFFKLYVGDLETGRFEREKRVNEIVGVGAPNRGKVSAPQLVASHTVEGARVLVFEAMDRDVLNSKLPIDELLNFINSHRLPEDQVFQFYELSEVPWFEEFLANSEHWQRNIASKLLQGRQIRVNFAHGDLGSENTYEKEGKCYLIDWECSGFDIPILVDHVSYTLGRQRSAAVSASLLELGELHDLCAAGVYLIAKGYKRADKVFELLEGETSQMTEEQLELHRGQSRLS